MRDHTEKSKVLFANIWLFFLASFIPKTITFFMVPLYTDCLTTDEYGTMDLITTTCQLLLPVLTLQIQDAVLRFSLREKHLEQVFSIGLRITLLGTLLLCGGVLCLRTTGFLNMDWAYLLFLIAYFLLSSLKNIMDYFLRAIDKVKQVTISTICNSIITVACNLLFLLVFRWGVRGYLLANVIGYAFSTLYMFIAAKLQRYIVLQNVDKELVKRVVSFSVPMAIGALSWWANNSLDKYLLTYFCGISAAGILAVAYKVPTILSVLGSTVSKAFSISAIQYFDYEDKDGFLGKSYGIISHTTVIFASCLMILNIPLAKILFQKDFYTAWLLVPPLLVAAVMNHLLGNCEQFLIAMDKTTIVSLTAILGAGLNLLLNVLLIPSIGEYGAVISTALGFSVVWLVRYIYVSHRINLKNNKIKEPVSYILLYIQMLIAYRGNELLFIQMGILIVLSVLYRSDITELITNLLVKLGIISAGKE